MTAYQMTTDQNRRVDLDWIRIAAFALLILYHVGMLYGPWTFHVKSAHAGPGPEPLMLALNPWRLGLLFFISGVASRFMLEKIPPGGFARQRARRLLVPVLFGMLIVVPPQSYFEVVAKYGFAGGFTDFYVGDYLGWMHRYVTPAGEKTGLILPTWNHLWFVVYLLVYTMLAAALAASPRLMAACERIAARILSGFRLIAIPAALLVAMRLALAPRFPETHALFDDWYAHPHYFLMFALGLLLARSAEAWATIERLRWAALALAVLGYAAFMSLRGEPGTLAGLARAAGYGIDQWCAAIAILGFGRRWLRDTDGPARRYLTDAVFPYYIVHQTALIALAVWLKPYGLSAFTEFALVVSGTAVACAATYEFVRRVAWLRAPFGLRAKPRSDARRHPAVDVQRVAVDETRRG